MRVSVVCIAIVAGTCVAVTCDAAHAQPERKESIRTAPTAALTEFWTEQRLQQAQPMPLPVVDPSALGSARPAEPKSEALRSGAAKVLRGSDSGVSGDVSEQPLDRAGKLYFSKADGDYVCSAQFIAPGILVTAAHCVRDSKTGQWATRVIYKSQYFRGKGKEYSTECLGSHKGWVSGDSSRWTWDYAMIKLRGGTDEGHLGWQIGWWGQHSTATKIGYPSDIEDGKVIQVEVGRLFKTADPKIIGLDHGNALNKGGSSGGAWVGRYDPRGSPRSNYIITVNSFGYPDQPGISFGPYWDSKMEDLLKYAQRGCR